MINQITATFLGLAIGDALGVPIEFLSRERIEKRGLIKNMEGFGTHNQPAGTWSDDSSLAFCLAEALTEEYDLKKIANNFLKWYEDGFWAAHGKIFDVGIATAKSIQKIKTNQNPLLTGGTTEMDNGNGSLMRIIPIIFYLQKKFPDDIKKRFECIAEVSSITHAHIRSIFSCFIYCEYALLLLQGNEKFEAFEKMQKIIIDFNTTYPLCSALELRNFHRILEVPYSPYTIKKLVEHTDSEIRSSGYVLHTLEASLWCFLTTKTYQEAVLKAVNLGEDTDTTGCVTGALAGLYYGYTENKNCSTHF
ncbi:MAG: ADP-ribosylglycohydrolase family protein [Bacteroidetes bacterium]|nr:MAG: ADP-ribosylglycohydrolase family protein [Bacteroidota bacterium]